MDKIADLINDIIKSAVPSIEHNDTVKQIEQVFRAYNFYTTREYQIFKIKDKSEGQEG